MQASPELERLIRRFESLGPDDCAALGRCYRSDARFKDPFNDLTGRAGIEAVFRHMFAQLDAPRFVVTGAIEDVARREAVLFWTFHFRFRRSRRSSASAADQCIIGSSHLIFDEDGLIFLHRDYWDAAEELYEKLPVIGSLMRWLKRRNRVDPGPGRADREENASR